MTASDAPSPVPAATAEQLLRLAGLPPPDATTIALVAVGAGNALAAIRAAGTAGFDAAPDAFVAELERLAADRD